MHLSHCFTLKTKSSNAALIRARPLTLQANQRRLEDLILRLLARDTGHGAPEGSPQLLAAQPDVKLALSLSSLGTPAN